jgi:hypothetical protein
VATRPIPASCLTPAQIEAVRKVYTGPVDARSGQAIYPGLERFDAWVTNGTVPNRIEASRLTADFKIDRTRPLCPWPQTARHKGSGSVDDAANFECRQ